MRPFFSYFGSKYRLSKSTYPAPSHELIIEPFAGSACYSTVHYQSKVWLNDIDPKIFGVWDFLIKSSADCIQQLPLILEGQTVDDLKICQEAKWLIGFWLSKSCTAPRRQFSSWALKYPKQFWGERKRSVIASQVELINHWKITNLSFDEIENQQATWFVDPPYQEAGKSYVMGSKGIDYDQLGAWCFDRLGQVMVCENAGADWLPFFDLAKLRNQRAKDTKEMIFMADDGQPNLFGVI